LAKEKLKRESEGWLIFFVTYLAGLVFFAISTPEVFSSIGDLAMVAVGVTIFALPISYVLNAVWIVVAAKKDTKLEGRWETAARMRNCYCGGWDKDPATYEKRGYLVGFCGICERCGAPGHTRHFPGPVPYTGAWCDKCYRVLKWTWPFRALSGWAYILAIVMIISLIGPIVVSAIEGALR